MIETEWQNVWFNELTSAYKFQTTISNITSIAMVFNSYLIEKKNKCDKIKKLKYNNNINMKNLLKPKTKNFVRQITNINDFLSSKRVNYDKPLNYLVAGAEFMNGKYYIELGDKNKLYDLVINSFKHQNFIGMITECRSQYYPMFFDIDGIPFEIEPNDFIDCGLEEFIIIENSNNNNLELKKYKLHFPNLIVDSNFMLYFLEFIKSNETLGKYHKYMDKCVYTSNGNRLLYTQGDKKTYYSLENSKFYGIEEITNKLELMNMISIYTPHYTKISDELLELNNMLFNEEEIKDVVKKDIEIILTAPYLSKKQKSQITETHKEKFSKDYKPQTDIEIAINKCLCCLDIEELSQEDWFKCLVICKSLNTPEVFWKWNSTYSKVNESEDKKRWDIAKCDKISYGSLHHLIKKYKGDEFYNSIRNEINIYKKKPKNIIVPTKTILLGIAERAYYGEYYDKYKKGDKNKLLKEFDSPKTAGNRMINKLVKKMNEHLTMIISDGAVHYIFENFQSKNSFDIKKNSKDIKDIFKNRDFTIEIIEKDKNGNCEFTKCKIKLFDLWMESEQRKEKLRKYFNPVVDIDEEDENFNLFRGFNHSKKDMELWGDDNIKPLTDHILNIWCKGNKRYCEYVLNYFSWIYQKPNQKTKVMLCVKSKYEGAGKSLTINKIFEGLGKEYIFSSADKDQVLGRFNGQMSSKLIIVLEEAFFSGDKRCKSKLKEYITGEVIPIEKKGIDMYDEDAYHNYISFSNETWYAPVDNGSRRYFCLEASNKYAGVQDKEKAEYFNKIAELDSRNIAKFFYERDITDFNPRKFELTEYMIDQMENGFNSVEKYMAYLLEQGFIKFNIYNDVEEKLEFNKPIQKERMYAYYKSRYEKDYSFIRDEGQFWKKLKDVLTDTNENCYMKFFKPFNNKRMVKLDSFNQVLEFWKNKYGYDPHNDNKLNLTEEDKTDMNELNKNEYNMEDIDSD